jgi:DNA-binding protein H-NS
MDNINENPIVEETTYESPVFETPVFEAPVVEEPVVEEPVVEAPVVEHVEETPVVEEVQAVVEAPAYQSPEEVQALGYVAEGVIGATTAAVASPRKKKEKAVEVKEKVAIYSTKNVTWSGVGKVYRGYNIVEKDAAEKWLTRSHIRTATPEEVAKEFGK